MTAKADHRRAEVRAVSAEKGTSREQLLEAASRVFARSGYRDASMDEIAAEAGYSKGALYWNFESKQDLFFALLDELDDRLRALLILAASTQVDRDVTKELSQALAAVLEQNRDMVLLFHEHSAMAVRDPKLRERYAKRNAMLRKELGRAIEARFETLRVPLTISAERLATFVIAFVDGLSSEQLIDPGAVEEELFGEVLALIEAGVASQAKEIG